MLNNMTKHDRITPQYITSLREGEIFVFGSNKEGISSDTLFETVSCLKLSFLYEGTFGVI